MLLTWPLAQPLSVHNAVCRECARIAQDKQMLDAHQPLHIWSRCLREDVV